MTEKNLVDAIAVVIGGDKTAAQTMAKVFVSGAITKVGRIPNVDFNRVYVEFILTSGRKIFTHWVSLSIYINWLDSMALHGVGILLVV